MKHKALYYILAVLAALLMCSCGKTSGIRAELAAIDSLIETRPDSSLTLLRRDSARFVGSGKALGMSYVLSRTEAEDKLYIVHRSDSAMLPAAEYFDSHGTPLQRIRAWYILGRVYCDMLLYGRALSAFDKALSATADSTADICLYKSRAATWAGYVYEEKEIHDKALHYNKLSNNYAKLSNHISLEIYSLRDIGRSYRNLRNYGVAINYYLQASKIAEQAKENYLYNMVMEELAGVYLRNRDYAKASQALSTKFYNKYAHDLATHYFTKAMFYEYTENVDSAIYYNKKGMEYGLAKPNRQAALDLAKLYLQTGNNENAIKYFQVYSNYVDSLEHEQTTEYRDLMSHVEQMLEIERQNTKLANTKIRLTILLSLLIFVVIIVSLIIVKIYLRNKKKTLEQQERVRKHRKEQRLHDLQRIQENMKRIKELEKDLSASNETLTELRKQLLQNEAELLKKQNENLAFMHRHSELLAADFTDTEVYKLYHNPSEQPTLSDYHKLSEALNIAYNDYTKRLKNFYPDITDAEMWICCMVKTGLTPKEICNISSYTFTSLGMAKSRLYKKIFNAKGSTKDFDNFIRKF